MATDSSIYGQIIVNNSPNPIFIVDNKYNVIDANATCENVFGVENLYVNFSLLLADYIEEDRNKVLELLKNNLKLLNEKEVFLKINGVKYIFIINIVQLDGQNYAIILNNITENSLLNKKLKHQIELIEEYVLISKTDPKGVITYASHAFAQLAGYKKNELIGLNHRVVKHEDMPQSIYKEMWDTISNGDTWSGDIKNKKKDGGFYWVQAKVSPEYNYQGKLIGYVSVREDITLQKSFQETLKVEVIQKAKELREQEGVLQSKAKDSIMGEMIGHIAHQWKQPLSVLSLKASDIKIKYAFDAINQEYIDDVTDTMGKSIKYMSQTIDDFRNFFKPNKEMQQVEVKSVIEQCLRLLEPLLKTKSIVVNQEYSQCIDITSRQNELVHVFMNLIKNAIDILVEKQIETPLINIINFDKDGFNITIIEDNAGGIPKEIINEIFEQYFSTKGDEGTGLGLSMSKNIVEEQLGGKISVENSTIGAKFTIMLPLTN